MNGAGKRQPACERAACGSPLWSGMRDRLSRFVPVARLLARNALSFTGRVADYTVARAAVNQAQCAVPAQHGRTANGPRGQIVKAAPNGDLSGNPRQAPAPGARSALMLLLGINMFNYIDRYILAAALPRIEVDPAIAPVSKGQLGLLTTAFVASYLVLSPVFGWLGDRMSRWLLVGIGVITPVGILVVNASAFVMRHLAQFRLGIAACALARLTSR